MTWQPDHPGGVITCDAPGCTRSRRYYCSPTEQDEWGVDHNAPGPIRDYCPTHKAVRDGDQ